MIKLLTVTLAPVVLLMVMDIVRTIYSKLYVKKLQKEWELNNSRRKY